MFVVSVNDAGQVRTILATDVFINAGTVIIQAGGVRHEFNRDDLLDVVPVEDYLAGPASQECPLVGDMPRFPAIPVSQSASRTGGMAETQTLADPF